MKTIQDNTNEFYKSWTNENIRIAYKTLQKQTRNAYLIEFFDGTSKWFPKSRTKLTRRHITVPYWMWNKKENENVVTLQIQK